MWNFELQRASEIVGSFNNKQIHFHDRNTHYMNKKHFSRVRLVHCTVRLIENNIFLYFL